MIARTCDGRIECFYHQWRYTLDGTLQVVPQRKDQFPDLDVRDWGLHPASLEIWEGKLSKDHPNVAISLENQAILTNIDLIDRNLYERSCDVRWWATDSSVVDAPVLRVNVTE